MAWVVGAAWSTSAVVCLEWSKGNGQGNYGDAGCADDDEKQLVEHGLLLLVPEILFIIVILLPLIFWMAGVLVWVKLGIHSLIITSTFIVIMLINNGGVD